MTKSEIFQYISHTPENINLNILGEMLDSINNNTNTNINSTKVFGVCVEDWDNDKTIDVSFESLYNAFNEDKICVIVIWSEMAESFYLARISELYAPAPNETYFEPYFTFNLQGTYYKINSAGAISTEVV